MKNSIYYGDNLEVLRRFIKNVCRRSLTGCLASSLIDRGNGVPADLTDPLAISLGGARLDRILNREKKVNNE